MDDDRVPNESNAETTPSCGELVLAHLTQLHELWRDGRYPIPAGDLSLPAVLADRGFREGMFAGLVAYTTTDAGGVTHHLHSREVLRLELDLPVDVFPWRCLDYATWESEGGWDAVSAHAEEHRRQLPTYWPNDPLRDAGE